MNLSEFILEEMKKREMSMREFSSYVGVSPTTISNTLNPQKNIIPSTDFLAKLADATHTDIATLIAMVFPELTDLNPEIMLLAMRISQLHPEQQKMIRQLLMGMAMDDPDIKNQ